MTKRNIVIVGGGFAGVALLRRLRRRVPDDWQVMLPSDEIYMTYIPFTGIS